MKTAVVGANGQLGSDVVAAFKERGDEVVELDHGEFDVADLCRCREALSALRPEWLVNTAAFHNVDRCEREPLKAYEVNAVGARNLAILSAEMGFELIHVSTDYVFDGRKGTPYVEGDPVCPLNVYGSSKAAGEWHVRSLAEKSLVVRVSAIYGRNPCRAKGGLNFVQLMLKFAAEKPEVRVVADEFVSPTPTADVARQVAALTGAGLHGICHATSEGSCSWHEFAGEIFRLKGIRTPLNPARPGEFPAKTPRPTYSVLENALLKEKGLNRMRDWREGLEEYLRTSRNFPSLKTAGTAPAPPSG